MLIDSFKRQLPALRAAALIALSGALLHIAACASRIPAPGSNAAPGASLPAADGTGLQIIPNRYHLKVHSSTDAALRIRHRSAQLLPLGNR